LLLHLGVAGRPRAVVHGPQLSLLRVASHERVRPSGSSDQEGGHVRIRYGGIPGIGIRGA
jgi:hypothetical protein